MNEIRELILEKIIPRSAIMTGKGRNPALCP